MEVSVSSVGWSISVSESVDGWLASVVDSSGVSVSESGSVGGPAVW